MRSGGTSLGRPLPSSYRVRSEIRRECLGQLAAMSTVDFALKEEGDAFFGA